MSPPLYRHINPSYFEFFKSGHVTLQIKTLDQLDESIRRPNANLLFIFFFFLLIFKINYWTVNQTNEFKYEKD